MINKLSNKSKVLVYILLIVGAIFMVFPFVWMFLTSGKTIAETTSIPPTIIPEDFQWQNYPDVFDNYPFASFIINTVIMIVMRVVTAVLTSAMAGFAMAKLKFPGKNLFFLLVLTQMMIPGQVYLIPQYRLVQSLGLLDTVTALAIPGLVSAFGTFLLRQFYLQLPDAYMEAAILDGASIWEVFFKVYLPLSKNGLVSLTIFTALFAYKDLMWPLIVNISENKMNISAGLATMNTVFTNNFPLMMAGAVIATIPMLIIFVIFQDQFVSGIATSGEK